jgi:hypothetical protein
MIDHDVWRSAKVIIDRYGLRIGLHGVDTPQIEQF